MKPKPQDYDEVIRALRIVITQIDEWLTNAKEWDEEISEWIKQKNGGTTGNYRQLTAAIFMATAPSVAAAARELGITPERLKLFAFQCTKTIIADDFGHFLAECQPNAFRRLVSEVGLNAWPYLSRQFRVAYGDDETRAALSLLVLHQDVADMILEELNRLEGEGKESKNRIRLATSALMGAKLVEVPQAELAVALRHTKTGVPVPDLRIEELDFSNRTFNCLRKAGIMTVGDLADWNAVDLAKIRNFGLKALHEVHDKLGAFAIELEGYGELLDTEGDDEEEDEE